MVKHFGVTPYMVFDGDFLPSKARTESSRAKRRADSRKAGLELVKAGKPAQAQVELQKAIDVTPEMARHLIEELKKEGVPYIVAPYEADAQLVYLERHGFTNGIISEDSDLLVFGAKRLLTKMDQYGQCVEINRRDFGAVREISLTGWTDDQFRQMAIFSGCDYLESIGNMGLRTAYRMMRKYKTPERVIRMLHFDGKFRVSENYLAQYKQAELTFIYQRVFCPQKKHLVLLTEPNPASPLDIEEMPYIGARVEAEIATAVAAGDVNPITKEPINLIPLPDKRRTNASALPVGTGEVAPGSGRPTLKKPIDTYFKGHKRVPMGEMDRNCFPVTPDRVAALTQNGLTPRVFPLPRPYLDDVPRSSTTPIVNRRRTEPISRQLPNTNSSVVPPGSVAQTIRQVRRTSEAGVRPQKKARLCEDYDALELLQDRLPEKSKFFPRVESTSHPADRIELMSDESLDEALSNLPDIGHEWKNTKASETRQNLEIFQDDTSIVEAYQTNGERPANGEHSKSGSARTDGADSRVEVSNIDTKQEAEKLEGGSLRVVLKDFSYTPGMPKPEKSTRLRFGIPTPASSNQKPPADTGPQLFTPVTPIRTPLQRLGTVAMQRSMASPLVKHKDSTRTIEKPGSLAKSLDRFPINPAFVPLPKVDLAEVEALNKAAGSEDQIIPDSDEENDPPFSASNVAKDSSTRIDLSRFIYS